MQNSDVNKSALDKLSVPRWNYQIGFASILQIRRRIHNLCFSNKGHIALDIFHVNDESPRAQGLEI